VQKRYKYKDVMRFNEIAEILSIDFESAEGLFVFMNEKTPVQRYEEMIRDENALRDPDMLISDKRNEQIDKLINSMKTKSELMK